MPNDTDFKTRLYENYYRTHILPRKGSVTLLQLKRARKVFDQHFSEFLPQNKASRILDVGCGAGNLVFWLHDRGYSFAEGIDTSPDQIAAGQALGITRLEVANLFPFLQKHTGTYDVIFMRDVLEHIERSSVFDVLELALRALAPGGQLVLQLPNGASPFVGRVLYGDFTHEFAYTQTSLSQIFLSSGYSDIRFRPFSPYSPKLGFGSLFSKQGWAAIVRRASWKITRSIYYFLLFSEIGPHSTILTFNLIAAASRPRNGDH